MADVLAHEIGATPGLSAPVAGARPKAFWPLTIPSTGNKIDFTMSGSPLVATVQAATYTSPQQLASYVLAALIAAINAGWTVTVNAEGRFVITAGTAFTLNWENGPNAAHSIATFLGWTDSDDQASVAGSATAPRQHQNAWYASDQVVSDSGDRPLWERAQKVAPSGRVKGLTSGRRRVRDIKLGFLPSWKVWVAGEGTTHPDEAIERLYDAGWAKFRWWPDAADDATFADYALDADTAGELPFNRLAPGSPVYSLDLRFLKLPV